MLVVAALLAGVAIGFYLAVVVITIAFEHPTSLECAPRRDYIRDLFSSQGAATRTRSRSQANSPADLDRHLTAGANRPRRAVGLGRGRLARKKA